MTLNTASALDGDLGVRAIDATTADRAHRLPPHPARRRLVAPLHRPRRGAAGSSPGHRHASGTGHPTGPQRRRLGRASPPPGRGRAGPAAGLLHQPTHVLLTALCGDNGDRVDLLVVPPDTDAGTADAAMVLAATTSNRVHAQHILVAAASASSRPRHGSEDVWETDGGRLRATAVFPNAGRLTTRA